MNDPNGMVFHKGIYHLFYQYHPDDIKWGPMHWGHATSTDLIHWRHGPIALYPDNLGYIFSGSAVLDVNNSSGLGTVENPPLVAIFTYHDMAGQRAGKENYETQGIAYSLDNGESWTKYAGNPVIENRGMKDFRDPKVFWHTGSNSWILTLVAGDHAQFYRSKNLKEWTKVGEFGHDRGAHGGVWECPDLFPMQVEGVDEEKFVLFISINPGAPNGGSGTQYFVGDFDGNTFSTDQKEPQWIDWGTDNYAGVTYSNAPNDERIFIGWMSNWAYAQDTPTEKWRSAMTLPRKLTLHKKFGRYELASYPVEGLERIVERAEKKSIRLREGARETMAFENFNQAETRFVTTSRNFTLRFKNDLDEALVLNMDGTRKQFLLDRAVSGKTRFKEAFAARTQRMPLAHLPEGEVEVRVLMDRSSVEVFINGGLYVMTAQLFPNAPYNQLEVENNSQEVLEFKELEIAGIRGIWSR